MTKWVAVPGYEGRYEVSSCGQVRSLGIVVNAKGGANAFRKGRILKQAVKSSGYRQVTLCAADDSRRSVLVHVLVAQAFLGQRPRGHHVRHLDCNPANNCVENITYGSPAENAKDTIECGRRPRGDAHPRAKLTEFEAREILESKGLVSPQVLALVFGIAREHVWQIQSGRCWAHLQLSQTDFK